MRTPGESTDATLTFPAFLYPTTLGWKAVIDTPGNLRDQPAGFAFTRAGALRKACRAVRSDMRRVAASMP